MVSSNENSHFIFRLKKTVTLTIFTALNIFFTIQDFSAMALALKNRVAQKFFTVLKYILSFRIFEQIVLALKTEFALKCFKPGGAAAFPDPPPRTPMEVGLQKEVHFSVRSTIGKIKFLISQLSLNVFVI